MWVQHAKHPNSKESASPVCSAGGSVQGVHCTLVICCPHGNDMSLVQRRKRTGLGLQGPKLRAQGSAMRGAHSLTPHSFPAAGGFHCVGLL